MNGVSRTRVVSAALAIFVVGGCTGALIARQVEKAAPISSPLAATADGAVRA